jgi:hypothetical protein
MAGFMADRPSEYEQDAHQANYDPYVTIEQLSTTRASLAPG